MTSRSAWPRRLAALLVLLALISAAGRAMAARLEFAGPTSLATPGGQRLSLVEGGETLLLARAVGDDGAPLVDATVSVLLISPSLRSLGSANTDSTGLARFVYRPGGPTGGQVVELRLEGAPGGAGRLLYQVQVHPRGWILIMFFGLIGGVGIFLFGMDLMSASLQRSAGGRLRALLSALTRNRLMGLVVGAFVTVLIQSSSATTVLLVSFVQAGLMSFTQTLGVILGADIGTTVTAQLIAFQLTEYALLAIGLGFLLRTLARRPGLRHAGEVLLGAGLLFFGMHVMSQSMAPLRSHLPFLALLQELENPVAGIVVGTIFTALIHSSAAFLGLVIVLAQQGRVSLDAAIPLMFGANIGTCVTAALGSLKMGRPAKRVALAHTAFKVLGVLLAVAWIPQLASLVRAISPAAPAVAPDGAGLYAELPRQIANAHTIFNVGLALLFLPFTGLCARAVVKLLPDRPEPPLPERLRARHLEPSLLGTPALALNLAKVEILRLGKQVKEMTELVIEPLCGRHPEQLAALDAAEERVDALDAQITSYLLEIGRRNLSPEQTEEVYLMLHVTKLFELSSDVIHRELKPLAQQKRAAGLAFSEQGEAEVRAYHLKVVKQIARALDAFRDNSLAKAQRMTHKQARYVALEESFRRAHFERVRGAVSESVASSELHIALMDSLRKINSHSADIARAMLTRFARDSRADSPANPQPEGETR